MRVPRPLLLGMTADLMDLDKTPPAAELEDAAEELAASAVAQETKRKRHVTCRGEAQQGMVPRWRWTHLHLKSGVPG